MDLRSLFVKYERPHVARRNRKRTVHLGLLFEAARERSSRMAFHLAFRPHSFVAANFSDLQEVLEHVATMDILAAAVEGRHYAVRDAEGAQRYVIDQIEAFDGDFDHVRVRWLSWEGASDYVTVEPLSALPFSPMSLFHARLRYLTGSATAKLAETMSVDAVNSLLAEPCDFTPPSQCRIGRYPRFCAAEERLFAQRTGQRLFCMNVYVATVAKHCTSELRKALAHVVQRNLEGKSDEEAEDDSDDEGEVDSVTERDNDSDGGEVDEVVEALPLPVQAVVLLPPAAAAALVAELEVPRPPRAPRKPLHPKRRLVVEVEFDDPRDDSPCGLPLLKARRTLRMEE